MKKILTVLILSILLTALQSCQRDEPVEPSEETTPHIASDSALEDSTEAFIQTEPRVLICRTVYDTNSTEISRTEYRYDEDGNIACEFIYYNGELQQSSYYTYGLNQRLVRMIVTDLFTEQSMIYEYEYDNSGNKITETISQTHGFLNKRAYEYDDLDRVIKVTNSSNNSTVTFTYGEDNSCIKLERYKYNGEVIFNQTEKRYNESGEMIYQASYKQNSLVDIEYETIHTYNSLGHLEKSETYMDEALFMSITNEYQGDLLIRAEHADAEGIYLIVEYKYNQYGDLIKITNKSPSGLTTGYSVYEYADPVQ